MSKPRKIAQYTLEGEFIRVFDSARKAGLSFGRQNGSDLTTVCKFIRTSALGFRWLFEKDIQDDRSKTNGVYVLRIRRTSGEKSEPI